jgi:hypothetical protein
MLSMLNLWGFYLPTHKRISIQKFLASCVVTCPKTTSAGKIVYRKTDAFWDNGVLVALDIS